MKEYHSHEANRGYEHENKELLSRYQATLVGGALGDTLGMPVEGWNRKQIKKYIGQITEPIAPFLITDNLGNIVNEDENGRVFYISSGYQKGQWTDDTALSLAAARSIVEVGGFDLTNHVKHNLAIYHVRETLVHGNGAGSFGGTTKRAFQNLENGVAPVESGVMGKYPGNAPVLKMAPIAMYMYAAGKYEEGIKFAAAASRMTHLDTRSIASGIVQAHAVYSLLQGVSKIEFLKSCIDVAKRYEEASKQANTVTISDRLSWVFNNRDTDVEAAYESLGPGWPVTKNYPFTIFMFQKYWDEPLEGLLATVNSGGDCDSTGAIYGALAGARNGMFYPESWKAVLENREELETLATKIFNLKKVQNTSYN